MMSAFVDIVHLSCQVKKARINDADGGVEADCSTPPPTRAKSGPRAPCRQTSSSNTAGCSYRATTATPMSASRSAPMAGEAAWMIGAALASYSKSTRSTSKSTKADLPHDKFLWNDSCTNTMSQLDYSPVSLFELFISDDVVEFITVSSVEYARQKGNHVFQLMSDDVHVFLATLFTSG